MDLLHKIDKKLKANLKFAHSQLMYIELIKNKINRRLNLFKKKLIDERPGSYPYISGDTFRLISDVIIESKQDLIQFTNITNLSKINKIFVSLSFINKHKIFFLENLNKNSFSLQKINLILHNGDKIPDENFFLILSKLFNKIYCVNSMYELNNVVPLPIGLENYHLFKNGKIEEIVQFNNLIKENQKDISLFSCFDISTNYNLRKPIFEKLNKSRYIHIYNSLDNKKYLQFLKRSLFIISPPGNGKDCHRNWEAIYYKCIPIVLNNYLPKFFIDNLPILSVNTYDEILNKTDYELNILYHKIKNNRNTDIAYFEYWNNRINNE